MCRIFGNIQGGIVYGAVFIIDILFGERVISIIGA